MQDITKTKLKSGLLSVVTVAFVFVVVVFFYTNPERLERFSSLSVFEMVSLLTLAVLTFVGLALQNILILRPCGIWLPVSEAFGLAVISSLLNYMPLKLGALGKGLYLKAVHRLMLKHYVGALAAGQLIWVTVSGALGLLSYLVLTNTNIIVAAKLRMVAFVLLLATLAAFMVFVLSQYIWRFILVPRWRNLAMQLGEALGVWYRDIALLSKFAFISLLLFVMSTLKIGLSFNVVGAELSLLEACFLQACVTVAFAFSLIPGNVGVREGMLVGLAMLTGVEVETAFLAALIDRVAILLPTLLLGPLFIRRLGKEL